ncbi:hypothetical protein AAXB25_22875 [Paenibacillus lautus]|uniref:hypothetical protein n=1 Tax=Paenibacillus lautus TaxID=1401 RepID=UPI003D27B965
MSERFYTLENGNELIVTEKSTLFVRMANESTVFAAYPDMVFGEVLKLIDTLRAEIEDVRIKYEMLSSEYVENLLLLNERDSESIILAEELLRLTNLDHRTFTSKIDLVLVD